MSTTYLITGANRGIGRGLADIVLTRPNHHLIACVRDPSSETSQSLLTQPKAGNNTVTIIQYDASDTKAAATAIETLQKDHNITQIDTVIANAGAMGPTGSSTDLSPEDFLSVFTSNTLGPITLFNATRPLLLASRSPKFVAVSSAIGSTTMSATYRSATALPYGISKAGLSHAMVKMNRDPQNERVAFGLLTPGPTKTTFGGPNVDWDKLPGAQSMDVVVPGMMERIDEIVAVGKKGIEDEERLVLKDWKGTVIPW